MSRSRAARCATRWAGRVVVLLLPVAAPSSAKTLIDDFLPIPVTKPLVSNAWGASGVLPRDQDNGAEEKTNKSYSYRDGRILRAADGE